MKQRGCHNSSRLALMVHVNYATSCTCFSETYRNSYSYWLLCITLFYYLLDCWYSYVPLLISSLPCKRESLYTKHAYTKNLKPCSDASPGTALMAPSTCSPRSSFLFNLPSMIRMITVIMIASAAVAQSTLSGIVKSGCAPPLGCGYM